MGLRDLVERLLARSARPTRPAGSTFGAEAERLRQTKAAADQLEWEREKGKGRPQGF